MATSLQIEGRPMRKNGGAVEIKIVKLKEIKLSRNSRMNIRDEELSGLMASIKEEGMLEPIGLVKTDGGYEICYGNRRFLACSKLGYSTIPAVIHEIKDAKDIDMKNLAENIQRRSITLQEAGRYMELLNEKGLTNGEIAVRLGVSDTYVSSCLTAWKDVPKEFRNDLEVRVFTGGGNATRVAPGKISIATAKQIINSTKVGSLNKAQAKALLTEARDNPEFQPSHIRTYIRNVVAGKKSISKIIKEDPVKLVQVTFYVSRKDYESLEEKHVTNGAFRSITELCRSVLRGEKSVRIPMVKDQFKKK